MTKPRKVALLANCLLNQNAKVCEGARYPGVASPVVEALRKRGYDVTFREFEGTHSIPVEVARDGMRWIAAATA